MHMLFAFLSRVLMQHLKKKCAMQEKREMKNRDVNIDTILFSEIYGL